ncbi:MAG: acylphosphatase [Sideroxydans sp. RIFOXYB12_FULL_59_6]|nr:MAG: acylphosphatase [Sideroxydans sp. RIFOXYB12_FULL_59_6]
MSGEVKTLNLRVHGRVQGVWFRDSMRREAEKLGVNGWCRNRSDGTVEAMLQGEAGAVDALLAWAHRGPERAQVSRVVEEPGSGSFADFEVRGDV